MWNSIVSVWVEFPPYSWPGLPWPGSESCTELFIHPGCTAEGRASCQLVGAEQLISVVQQLAGNCCSKFSYSSELLFQIKKKKSQNNTCFHLSSKSDILQGLLWCCSWEMLLPAGTAGRSQEQSGCVGCTIHVRGIGLTVPLEPPSRLLCPRNVPVATLKVFPPRLKVWAAAWGGTAGDGLKTAGIIANLCMTLGTSIHSVPLGAPSSGVPPVEAVGT